jgi:hypothetical protein
MNNTDTVDRDNYTSAFRFRSAVEKQIKLEIELRNYIVTKTKPVITKGKLCIIHICGEIIPCKRPLEARQRMVRIMRPHFACAVLWKNRLN